MFKFLKNFFDKILFTKKRNVYEIDEHAIDLYGPRWPAKNSTSPRPAPSLLPPPSTRRRRDRKINERQPAEPIIVHDDHSLEFLASALIIESLSHETNSSSAPEDFSGKGGDFGGAGASGSWDTSSSDSSSSSSSD